MSGALEHTVVQRGRIVSDFMIKGQTEDAEHADPTTATTRDDLMALYYAVEVRRLLQGFMISGVTTSESHRMLLQAIVRAAFAVVRPAGDNTNDDVMLTMKLSHCAARALAIDGIGEEGGSVLGRTLLLGTSSEEGVPLLRLKVHAPLSALRALQGMPRLIKEFLHALESAIPLHLDFRVSFRGSNPGSPLRLQHDASLLGVTSFL